MLVYYFVLFIVSNPYLLFWVSDGHNSVTVQNWTHIYMNIFDHKDLGNHLLQLCPKVVKHPVYSTLDNLPHVGVGVVKTSFSSQPWFTPGEHIIKFCSKLLPSNRLKARLIQGSLHGSHNARNIVKRIITLSHPRHPAQFNLLCVADVLNSV